MEQEGMFSDPCSNGSCLGHIDERGFCNVCGRLKGMYSEAEEFPHAPRQLLAMPWYGRVLEAFEGFFSIIVKGGLGLIIGLLILGVVLFVLLTAFRVGWKFLLWAWT